MKKSYEHEFLYSRLKNPQFVAGLLEKAAISAAAEAIESTYFQPVRSIRRALFYPIRRLLTGLGVNPRAVKILFQFRRKGGIIKKYRKQTGLEDS